MKQTVRTYGRMELAQGNPVASHIPPSGGVYHLLRLGSAVTNNLHRNLTF